MHPLTLEYLTVLRFDGSQVTMLRSLGGCQGKQQLCAVRSSETLESLHWIAVIVSPQLSSRLEGAVVVCLWRKSLVIRNAVLKRRSEQEITGCRDALALVYDSSEYMTFNEGLAQTERRLKPANNDFVERQPDGVSQLCFQPDAAHLATMTIFDRTLYYATALDQHLSDPLAMLDFLCIHPFPDGNGRMSRLLSLLLLSHFDYAVGRYISLERIFEDTKESSRNAFESSSQGWHQGQHDVKPWLDYFWGTLLRAYREFEERVGTIERGRGSKGDRVRSEVLGRTLPFSISEIEEACPGVSRDMVRLVLRAMKSEGLIESTGKGRGAKWKSITEGTSGSTAVLAIGHKMDQ